MAKIESIKSYEILTSSGVPTIQTTVVLEDGTSSHSSVPLGSVRGTYESSDLIDEDKTRLNGQGVLKAIDNVNTLIAPKIIGMEAVEQQKIDKALIELDGTQNKMKLGSNSLLSISQAVAKAAAKSSLLPLSLYLRQLTHTQSAEHKIPTPMFDMLEGGRHAQNTLDFQEYLIIPATSNDIRQCLEIGSTILSALKNYLIDNNQSILSSIEGGFAPSFPTNADAFRAIKTVIEMTKYSYLRDVFMGVDVNGNNILYNKKYSLKENPSQLNQDDMVGIYQDLVNEFELVYIEDPFAEDDWEGWKKMFTALSSKALITGDAVVSTNPYRLQTALNNNVLNALVVKPSQIGTVTESMAVVEIAKFKQLKIIVSGRSYETEDNFISDFAVAVDSDYVKFGAPSRERIYKYNRLLAIEEELKVTTLK